MVFEKDDEDGLPELPSWNRPRDSGFGGFPEVDEKHSLPSFPDSPSHNRFSQAAIKDAVSNESDEDDEEFEEKKVNVVEMEEWSPEQAKVADKALHEPTPRINSFSAGSLKPLAQRKADVYVKLDKFYSARKSLSEIREKLEEIDDTIKKIRETKLREEQELGNWERDIMQVKARMKEIGDSIFEKVE